MLWPSVGYATLPESHSRLTYVAEYGMALGLKLMATLDNNPAWIDTICEAIGTNEKERKKAGWNRKMIKSWKTQRWKAI